MIEDHAVMSAMMHSRSPFIAKLGAAAVWASPADREKIKMAFAAEWAVHAGIAESQLLKAEAQQLGEF